MSEAQVATDLCMQAYMQWRRKERNSENLHISEREAFQAGWRMRVPPALAPDGSVLLAEPTATGLSEVWLRAVEAYDGDKDEAALALLTAYADGLFAARARWAPLEHEIIRARGAHPRNRHLTAALMEEAGEMAQAYLQGRQYDARQEALRVACVAIRVVEEGDADFES